ncbi:MAG: TolC family protein, partial [Pirellulales bacterium]|nr:TolC family protein [Pirellulales bacterium]
MEGNFTKRWVGLGLLVLVVWIARHSVETLAAAAEQGRSIANFVTPEAPPSSPRAEPMLAPMPPTLQAPDGGLAGQQAELSLEQLVREVQARNPSLEAMAAAWRAAAARYPQVVSLEDPMFSFMLATDNVGANEGESGYELEISQKVPWFGKRRLRGQQALAEADAARNEIGDTRLQLQEAARIAFYNYYLAGRLAAVNADTARLLDEFLQVAKQRYEVGQTTQQDVLQAEVESAQLQTRRVEFQRDLMVAAARINTLLHQPPSCPLPPPPANLAVPGPPASAD